MKQAATDVLKKLMENGDALGEVYRASKSENGSFDWGKFREEVENADLLDRVLGVDTRDIDAALTEVRAERKRLRDQWAGKEMPYEILQRLSHLSDVGLVLVDEKLDVGLTPAYVTWMMDNVMPLLEKAAPALFGDE